MQQAVQTLETRGPALPFSHTRLLRLTTALILDTDHRAATLQSQSEDTQCQPGDAPIHTPFKSICVSAYVRTYIDHSTRIYKHLYIF